MAKKVLRSDSGVTLIEISIAMSVLVIAISMMMGSLVGMQRSARIVQSKSTANTVLRSVTEQVRSMSFQTLTTTPIPIQTVDRVQYAVLVSLEDLDGNLVDLPNNTLVMGDFPNPIQAKVTLLWYPFGNSAGAELMDMSTRTLIAGTGAITVPEL